MRHPPSARSRILQEILVFQKLILYLYITLKQNKMKNINSIFNDIDLMFEQRKQRAKELNSNTFFAITNDHNPRDRAFKVSDVNPHFYEMTEGDHNGTLHCFIFKTTDVYGRHQGAGTGNSTEEQRILTTSEIRKPFYKYAGVEVGLTLEESLRWPTETCWGYSWGLPKYYIVKDGNTTVTESRSVIRKIYNNIEQKDEYDVIRFENEMKSFSTNIIDINELHNRKVFLVETESGDYLIGNEDDLWQWVYDTYDEEEYLEWWIQELGGKDEIVKRFVGGCNFSPADYLHYNFELKQVIPYEVAKVDDCDDRLEVNACTWDIDNAVHLSGRSAMKIIQ